MNTIFIFDFATAFGRVLCIHVSVERLCSKNNFLKPLIFYFS